MPSDFRVKTLDGIAEDWPFTYEQLLPYLEDVEHEVGVSGLPGKTAYLPQKAFPTPPLPIGKVGRKAAEGLDKLGWHWWPGTNAIPSVPYNGLNASVRRGIGRISVSSSAVTKPCRVNKTSSPLIQIS